jgi:two-component system, sensor histidine kinase RpfC
MAQSSLLARLHARLAGRPDTEHEQALVRIAIAGGILAYFIVADILLGEITQGLIIAGGFLPLSVLMFAAILVNPGVSRLRRIGASLLDTGACTFCMAVSGEVGAPLYVAYLWTTFGMGFRYGKAYLYNSLVLSVAGFGLVLTVNDFWIQNRTLGAGLLVGMIVLSLYVATLVKRLSDSVERAEAANHAKRRFLSTISHEMRTPLNAIIGMNDLLRDTTLSPEQTEMAKAMGEASQSMLKLVEGVLDISKIEAGKLSIEETDFDLHGLINGTAGVLLHQAEIRRLYLHTHVMPEVPHALRGDPYHLRQVLYNLIGNGIKFTESGGVTLTVASLGESDHAVRLRFEIGDTGVGIAPDAQERIFESFTQADNSTTRRYGGTGLGTTISRQLVEMMGGQIGLRSVPGKGSTFWFELTFRKQAAGTAPDAAFRLNDVRVMLVGFNDIEVRSLGHDLDTWGARTGHAQGIEAAAARLSEALSLGHPYHLVLVREGPDAGGEHVVARLSGGRGKKAPPAILCTPGNSDIRRGGALAGGFAAVLEMPFNTRLLFNAIHSATAMPGGQEGVISLSDYYAARDANRRRYQILVAEDNPTNQRVITGILERAGHRVRVVENGEQALDILENERFDVVIMDLNMPELGGLDAARAYRFISPDATDVPIIMLSADVTTETIKECRDAGVDAFLPKPVEARRLLDTIAGLVVKRSAESTSSARHDGEPPAVINSATLAELELIGSGGGFMPELVNGFIQDGEALLRQMEAAVAAGQSEALKDLVHAMKGSAVTLGADQLCRTCVGINAQSNSELEASGPRALKLVREHFQLTCTALLDYLKKHQSAAR